jgi:hypothetical protein
MEIPHWAAQNQSAGHEFESHNLDYSEVEINQTQKKSIKFSGFSKLNN